MKRPIGIILSAVTAIVGSSLILWIAAVRFLVGELARKQTGAPFALGPVFLFSPVFMAPFPVWGFATGVGLLRLQVWSRISMLAFSALLVALYALVAITSDIKLALSLCPFALLGGGWLYLFSTAKTKSRFQAAGGTRDPWARPLLIACFIAISTIVGLLATMGIQFLLR